MKISTLNYAKSVHFQRIKIYINSTNKDGEQSITKQKIERRGPLTGKTGAELREEFFMAAKTGSERGLPEGAFLNDNTKGTEDLTEIEWKPFGEKIKSCQGSSLLKSGVDAGAFEIGPQFCLTGQCDSCLVELDTGEAVLSCMTPVPFGRDNMTVTVVASDEAWETMCAGFEKFDNKMVENDDDNNDIKNDEDDFMFV